MIARWLVVLVAPLAACSLIKGKPDSRTPFPGPVPSKSIQRPALNQTIRLVEIREDGTEHPIAERGITEIDVNSRVAIRVDAMALRSLAIGTGGVTISAADRAELDRLTKLTRSQASVAKEVLELGSLVTESNVAQFAPQLTALGSKELEFANEYETYATSVGVDPDNDARPPAEVLAEQRAALLERLTSGSAVAFRLQAALVNGDRSVPVHLDNYDSLEPERCALQNKLSPGVTAREVQEKLAVAKSLATAMGDLGSVGDALVALARERASTLVKELSEAALSDAQTIEALVERVVRGKLVDVPAAKELKKRLGELRDVLKTIDASCRPVIDAVGKSQSPTLDQAFACGTTVAAQLKPLVDASKAAAEQVKVLSDAAASAAAEVKAEIEAFVPDLKVVTKMQELVAKADKHWETAAAFLGKVKDAAPANFTSESLMDRNLDAVTDTRVNLVCTSRKAGDLLHVRPTLVAGTRELQIGETDRFRIVRNGAHIDVSAAVMFVEQINDDHWGTFKASPGIVAALHYRNEREAGEARGSATWNALNPGLGVHFSYPDFGGAEGEENPSFELGVGATGLLFGDLLQSGVGYDIQADVWYWYVGFGLDSLADLGVTYGLPGR